MQLHQPKTPPILLSILLMLAAGCSGSKGDQARKLQQTRQSWEATVQLTTELWRKGALPAEYARQTLDAAGKELEKTRRKAEKLSQ
jgi:hypothetical protein